MLPTDTDAVEVYRVFQERFPSDKGALIVLEGLLCSPQGWSLILDLSDVLDASPVVERAISIAADSSRYVVEVDGVLQLDSFRNTPFDDSLERCEKASRYPPFKNTLVAESNKAIAFFILAPKHISANELSETLYDLIRPYSEIAENLGGKLVVTGEPLISAELSRVIASDNMLIALVVLVMLLLIYIVTKSLAITGIAFLLKVFVLVISFGMLGWIGVPITPTTSLGIFLLIPLSSATVIHACGYALRLHEKSFLNQSAKKGFMLAGTTTAVGFACTGLTPAEDVQSLALLGVVGIGGVTAGVFLFVLPLLKRLDRIEFSFNFAIPRSFMMQPNYGNAFLASSLIFIAIGITQLKFDYSPPNYLPITNDVRRDFEQAGKSFGRMTVPLMIKSNEAMSPSTWQRLKIVVEKIHEEYPSGLQASWFYDHISELNKAITLTADGAQSDFPMTADALAQLILWFEPRDVEIFLDDDREYILVLLQIPQVGSSGYLELKEYVNLELANNNLDGQFVGRVQSFFETGHRVGKDNLRGLAISAVLIFGLLLVLFKSIPLALVGIFVNSLPVLTGIAALGILNVPIDLGSSIVAAIAFGIVLDDSTHLLVRVQQLIKSGYDPSTGVVKALTELIGPIMVTTLVICVGFAFLFASELIPFNDFATVILIVLVAALATDICVLPVLVRRFIRDPLLDADK